MEEQEIFLTQKFFLIKTPQALLYIILDFIHVESCEKNLDFTRPPSDS